MWKCLLRSHTGWCGGRFSMRRNWALWWGAAVAIAASACGGSEKPKNDDMALALGSTCKAGKAIACKCEDGRMSQTTCISDRRMGDCPCGFGNSMAGDWTPAKEPVKEMPMGTGGAPVGAAGDTANPGGAGMGGDPNM